MIRINLLHTDRARAPRRSQGLQPEQKVTLACSLMLLATAVGVLWWWWALDRSSARLSTDLITARREATRLTTLLQQVDTFEKQRKQLQDRVALIEELRKGQSAPVHILDAVSRAVPDMLWLTELKEEPATGDLTIEGRCANLTSLSDFVGNLEQSGKFKKPVEILDSQVQTVQAASTDLIKFSVKAQYSGPGAPPPPVPPAAGKARQRAKR
jgi:type IV pilus assembly protein PilN